MNAQHPSPSTAAFHRERSLCLDAFVELEEAVRGLACRLQAKACPMLGPQIEALRKLAPSPRLSKARHAQMLEFLANAPALLELRNDLAHSRLRLAVLDDDHHACFINAQQTTALARTARLFTLPALRTLAVETRALASQLHALAVSPASSPPPPSPDAAGDP